MVISLQKKEHSLATTGSPVVFSDFFDPFWHLVGLSSSPIIRLYYLALVRFFYMDSLMVIQQLAIISTLVKFYFWWSSTSGGVLLHTASALPSGGDLYSLATAAVLTCPLWWSVVCGIVQFTQLHSPVSLVPDFLVTKPGSIPVDDHLGWQHRPFF